jgi:hypothetical protein
VSTVQAKIHLKVDFHPHNANATLKLAALSPTERQSFLHACDDALYDSKRDEFLLLQFTSEFRPVLELVPNTKHPSFEDIRVSLQAAVARYNAAELGMTFDEELPAEVMPMTMSKMSTMSAMSSTAIPPYSCVQYVWIDGHRVAIYNYDLVVLTNNAPTIGDLTASYRVALEYDYDLI